MRRTMRQERFHGRHETSGRGCEWPGCGQAGEFRAPGERAAGVNGPGSYRWFCLEHVRDFNQRYDYFKGMSAEEIVDAQSPVHGWRTESRAFRPLAGIDEAPRWADFADPLEAISARAGRIRARAEPQERRDGKPVTRDERRALETLGLPVDADRRELRERYSQLVRRYHPDRNGGDRSMEQRLQQVVEAYQLLRRAVAFA
jgi:hypothetical protein